MNEKDDDLAMKAKDAFDRSVDGLDAATLSRLNRGRQAALSELAPGKARRTWMRMMPVTGAAAAVLLAVVVLRSPGEIAEIPLEANGAAGSDLEILLGEESIEMLEDLEFYSWLATQDFAEEGDLG